METIDRAKLDEIRRGTEPGSNPFDSVPLGIVSVDFLKQERILDQLERASYDIIVIDEAHHCSDSGKQGSFEDSRRRRLAEVLARRCDSLLLLTATPHDGYDRSFASLCELLDPSLVDGTGSLRGEKYRNHVIRRLKKHIVDPKTGERQFKDRIVEPIAVVADPGPAREIHRTAAKSARTGRTRTTESVPFQALRGRSRIHILAQAECFDRERASVNTRSCRRAFPAHSQ